MQTKKFWNWITPVQNENESDAERVLELYGTIAETSWYDDDVTPEMFREELFSGSGPVTIYLSSPGGDCVAASQIYTMLMDYKGDVTVKIDGIAASAASVIAMAGTKVLMAPTAMMMCHNPATMAFGDHNDMKKAIELLDEVKESIINAYELKTGLPRKDISKLMENETWMNAQKAIDLGFADGMLTDEKKTVNAAAFAFSSKAVENALLNKLAAKYDREPEPQLASINGTQSTVPANPVREPEPQPVSVQEPSAQMPQSVPTQEPPAQPPQPEPEQPKTQPQRGRSVDELMGRLHLIQH